MSENEVAVVEKSPSVLIAMALDKNADPEVLSKLMDLQERWERNCSQKAFVVAMTAFKQEAPSVMKKHERANFGPGKASYSYANLGSIVQEISALLGKHELSSSWETSQDDKGLVVVSCHVTHSAGHRETVTLRGPADTSGSKNPIQSIGSTVTYLQRYTLLAVLGLATKVDDDGNGGNSQKPDITPPQSKSAQATEGKQLKTPDAPASEPQQKALHSMSSKAGVKNADFFPEINGLLRELLPEDQQDSFQPVGSTKELTMKQASDLIGYYNNIINKS